MKHDNSVAAGPIGAVLVVDDTASVRVACARALKGAGFRSVEAEDAARALDLISRESPEIVLTDIRMPGMSGLELLREIKRLRPETEVIVMTAYADREVAEEALNHGAGALLVKPFDDISAVPAAARKAMARSRFNRGQSLEDGPEFESIIKAAGLAGEDQIEEARLYSAEKSVSLKEALVELGFADPHQLDQALADHLDVPFVRLTEKMLDRELVLSFPRELARKHAAIPLYKSGNELAVASAEPMGEAERKELERATGLDVTLSLGMRSEILGLLDRFHGPPGKAPSRGLMERIGDPAESDRELLAAELLASYRAGPSFELLVERGGDGSATIIVKGLVEREKE